MLNKAIQIAVEAHQGQIDKGGNPYILHPLRVMLMFEKMDEQICAVLHDVVEDTNITLDDLRNQGFSNEVIDAIDCLTRREHEAYEDFISRILSNKIACRVKLGDLNDNMDLSRISNPSKKDRERIKKYQAAADRIQSVLPPEAELLNELNEEMMQIQECQN